MNQPTTNAVAEESAPGDNDLAAIEREQLRTVARGILGVTGENTPIASIRHALTETGGRWYPLVALGLLVIVDEFQASAFTVLGPEITATLGLSRAQLAAVVALKTIALTLAALPMASLVQRRRNRASVSVATAFVWSIMTLATGFVTSLTTLIVVLVIDGASTGSVRAVHQPLLMDSYAPSVRVRALSMYRGANNAGYVIAPLIVGACATFLALTWRGVFVVMGMLCLLAALASTRLRDPGVGTWDTRRVQQAMSGDEDKAPENGVTLGFFEAVRRLLLIPTIRKVLTALAVLGMLLIPFQTFLFFFLDERWGMGPGQRSMFAAGMPLFGMSALAIFGSTGERLFREDPAKVVRLGGTLLAAAGVGMGIAVASPWFAVMVLFFGLASGAVAALGPAMAITLLSIIPAQLRSHAAAIEGIALAAIGGFGGLILLGGVDRRFGTSGAILSLLVPAVVGGLILRGAARSVNEDLDHMIDEIVDAQLTESAVRAGTKLPLLACRGIDFSYGQMQVLFGVDFKVQDDEMVALLGTNGAGKSTLLRVISGLGLPSRGTVRFHGTDVTHIDAFRRVGLGICQVPGGRAVFGPMTVVENLRIVGHTYGRDRKRVESGIEVAFDAFPKLADRRNSQAQLLSGGEQQMLGLASALILKPKLLLIDELSLGLAPIVVAELLDMVRTIRDAGSAVVLVEQSVNIALSLVDHAYFMEKGQIRFDGSAVELHKRDDLLRSVFLEGAAQALGPNGKAPRG